ncbi:MAG: sulfite exporter TauE/SafE family protein [bacterium]|nr:sulfite exporter TauE/SafE family protein [bacterium]
MSISFVLGMLALGLAVGLISSALGLGGGIFMVPAFLTFVPGIDPGTAKGTSLFIIIFVATVNVWRLNRGQQDRQWGLAATIATGSIVGAYASGFATTFLPDKAIIWIFVAFLGVAAARTFLLKPVTVREEDVRKRMAIAVGIGLLTGIASGATGIGGGAVLVPLALLAGIVSNGRVVALSNTVMVATCTAAAFAHFQATKTTDLPWTYGQVNVALAPIIFIGAQIAGPFGKWVNARLTLTRRKVVMGVLLLVIALRLILRAMN